jgi:LAS superfamily LD-carboxypeptidase LdcB
MADIKGKIGQTPTGAVLFTEAYPLWARMLEDLKKDKGLELKAVQGYVSKFEIIDQLRKLVKNKAPQSDPTLASLLDPKAKIEDILGIKPKTSDSAATGSSATGSANITGASGSATPAFPSGSYEKLENYIKSLTAADYEPPLSVKQKSPTQTFDVPSFPGSVTEDPRRTGRLFVVEGETLKNKDLLTWIYNNSLLYGFLPYGSPEPKAFYYVGKDKLKELIRTSNDVGKIVSSFLQTTLPKDIITVSVDKILTHSLLPPGGYEFADPGNLDEIIGTNNGGAEQITNNAKKQIKMYMIPGDGTQAVRDDAAFAYAAMKVVAKQDGVNIQMGSGYRPAFGEFSKIKTKSGKQLSVTSQYSIRKSRAPGKGEDHWLTAPSTAYFPQVAPPGKSNHGNGIGLDLNTGGFPAYPDKPFSQGGKIMEWLTKNAHRFGFMRSVSSEPWHWEYYPPSKPFGSRKISSKDGPYAIVPKGHVSWGPYGNVDWQKQGGFAGAVQTASTSAGNGGTSATNTPTTPTTTP